MKITSPTPNTLEIKSGGASAVVIGFIFLAIGVVVAIVGIGTSAPSPLIGHGIGAIFIVIGLISMLVASSETVVLRKGAQSSVEKRRVIGGSIRSQTFDTSLISAVQLVTSINTTTPTGSSTIPGTTQTGLSTNSRRSVLSLLLNDNSKIVVGMTNGSGTSVNGMNVTGLIQKAPLANEAKQIADFLGVPLDAGDYTNLATTIRSVRENMMGENNPPTATPPTVPTSPQPSETEITKS